MQSVFEEALEELPEDTLIELPKTPPPRVKEVLDDSVSPTGSSPSTGGLTSDEFLENIAADISRLTKLPFYQALKIVNTFTMEGRGAHVLMTEPLRLKKRTAINDKVYETIVYNIGNRVKPVTMSFLWHVMADRCTGHELALKKMIAMGELQFLSKYL